MTRVGYRMDRPTIEESAIAPEEDGGKYFTSPSSCEMFSSGCTLLDCTLGGGWARGRVLNIVGDKSTGKTLLAEEALANFLLKYHKGKVKYREIEKAFDENYARALGIPVDRIDFDWEHPCKTVENVFDELEKFSEECVKAKQPGLYILDSLDALSSEREVDQDFGAASFGTSKAQDMSKMFRLANQTWNDSDVTVLIVSQIRDNVGVTFGRTWERSGGRALDFYASQVVFLAKMKTLELTKASVTRAVGISVKAKADKVKVGLPYRECIFPVIFGYGVDDIQANVTWLAQVKRLSLLGLETLDDMKEEKEKDSKEEDSKTKHVNSYVKSVRSLPDPEYFAEKDRIAAITTKEWLDIEEKFAPTRRKYTP